MKYLYSWIKEISNTKLSPAELANEMTNHAFEVDGVLEIGSDLEGVVIGKVLSVEKHPDADRLNVAKVDVGKEELQIVCGAPNLGEGQTVAVALVEAVLPGDFEIKKAKIRGVESHGMICAEDELGLGTYHEGIMILDDSFQAGEPFAKVFGVKKDTIIDLSILSNRGHDVLSHVGISREVCALGKTEMSYDYDALSLDKAKKEAGESGKIEISIEDNNLCKRYAGVLVEGVSVKESPEWMKGKLRALGMKSINNIVDATNFVMLELGQPLHAFDADFLRGDGGEISIEVKSAKDGEKMTLLDDSEKELRKGDLVIASKGKNLALAGIMGGKDSGIQENTKNIFIEGANFDFVSIRKTRMRLGLKTDSSDRFEKELDPNLVEKGVARVLEIIQEVSGGEVKAILDVHPEKVENWSVKVDLDYLDKLLGCKVPKDRALSILKSLEIGVEKDAERILVLNIPTFRIDLKNQEDIIEEIGRMYGYDNIEPQALLAAVKSPKIDVHIPFEREIKRVLVGSGFSEIYGYCFYSKEDAKNMGIDEKLHLELENPMNPSQELMQLSLIPGVLKAVNVNLKNFDEFRIFEMGREYWKKSDGLSDEKRKLVGAVVLKTDKKAETFFDAKGEAESLIEKMGIADVYYENLDREDKTGAWHPSRSAYIRLESGNEILGVIGEIDPNILEKYSIKKRVAVFELDLDLLRQVSESEREYEPIRKHPVVSRDISMIAGEEVRVAEILESIQNSGGDLVLDVDLFDIFEIEEEQKNSFAFHILLGADDKTLEGKEIERTMERIMNDLESGLDVEVRR